MPDRIPARRHPHQVFIGGLCVVAGAPALLGKTQPSSLAASLPAWLLAVWSLVLAVGGVLVVAAAIVRAPLRGLYLEAAAHLPLAVMTIAYGSALVAVNGVRGVSAAAIVFGFGVAEIARFVQVTRTLHHLHGVLQAGGNA